MKKQVLLFLEEHSISFQELTDFLPKPQIILSTIRTGFLFGDEGVLGNTNMNCQVYIILISKRDLVGRSLILKEKLAKNI
ncbi:hypothetical protein H5410_017545 [Solanum commersonii]|uniref:Uncharacterized protein n=1 Tax=Solanum commersonii TaxID=4109 RepID=A0A9J5ZZL2_SOLCO|nr:hypothetical protein H5410_017545 [Solanum commersonii]